MFSSAFHSGLQQAITRVQVLAEKLAWSMAKKFSVDLVTIHPALVLGTVYYANEVPISIQMMKVAIFLTAGSVCC